MTAAGIGAEAKERVRIMTSTGNGFEIAEKVGWTRVFASLERYEVMEKDFFRQPLDFARNLKEKLLLQAV